MTRIHRSIKEPIRTGLEQPALWQSEDKGLIKAWETGRQLASQKPELAEAMARGELPMTNWKGGVLKKIQKPHKIGSLHYLAQRQGLLGQDLDIELDKELTLTCSKHGMKVIYTADLGKMSEADTEEPTDGAEPHERPASGISEQSLFS